MSIGLCAELTSRPFGPLDPRQPAAGIAVHARFDSRAGRPRLAGLKQPHLRRQAVHLVAGGGSSRVAGEPVQGTRCNPPRPESVPIRYDSACFLWDLARQFRTCRNGNELRFSRSNIIYLCAFRGSLWDRCGPNSTPVPFGDPAVQNLSPPTGKSCRWRQVKRWRMREVK